MQYWTLAQLENKIKRELDLEAEDFISPDELTSYVNEAIDICETMIMGLYEDYFLTKTQWLTITDPIELPENIYASKIRRFELRENDRHVFQIYKNNHLKELSNSLNAHYNLYNYQGAKPVVEIEGEIASAKEYRIFYIRNANRVAEQTDLIDLPECSIHFVHAFVKAKCYEKEIHPNTPQAKVEVTMYRDIMVEALNNIVDDGTDIIDADLSHYLEFENGFYYY